MCGYQDHFQKNVFEATIYMLDWVSGVRLCWVGSCWVRWARVSLYNVVWVGLVLVGSDQVGLCLVRSGQVRLGWVQ